MSLRQQITCDGPYCMAEYRIDRDEKPHQARNRLRSEGWHVSLPGGTDYCPRCLGALKRERRTRR